MLIFDFFSELLDFQSQRLVLFDLALQEFHRNAGLGFDTFGCEDVEVRPLVGIFFEVSHLD